MSAVIQLQICKDGEFPTFAYARRDEALFAEVEWSWCVDAADAFVFPDYPAAVAMAAELLLGLPPRQFCYAVCRAADDSQSPTAESQAGAAMSEPARAAAVRGVSPSQMARGDTPARIAAARQNRRVTAQRRTAEDFRRVYEETCKRLGERDGDE